jgi:hypothetical protein
MGRLFVLTGLLVAVTGTAGCSTATIRSTAPTGIDHTHPVDGIGTFQFVRLRVRTASSTRHETDRGGLHHLCALSDDDYLIDYAARATARRTAATLVNTQVAFHPVWTNTTPRYEDVGTLADVLSHILAVLHQPPDENLAWVEVDLTITNNGQQLVGMGGATGSGEAVLTFAINDSGGTANGAEDSAPAVTGFVFSGRPLLTYELLRIAHASDR